MKYIRTKDGIINYDRAIHSIKFWCSEHCYNYYFTRKELKRFDESIKNCKQADTIEELCDEFVVVIEGHNNMNRVFGLEKAKEYWLLMKYKGYKATLYGCIWTDKGLIYVAKMNEKGELELL